MSRIEEWNTPPFASTKEGQLVVVDFFATWCPPCKKAAPLFARMSIAYDSPDVERIAFLKVDVDKVKALAKQEKIGAMPTFRLYKRQKDGKLLQVDEMVGWSEAKLKALIDRHLEANQQQPDTQAIAPETKKTI